MGVLLPSPVKAGDNIYLVPPEPYLSRAQEMVRTGEGPGWVMLPQSALQRACHDRRVLWGCHVQFGGLDVIYVLDELNAHQRKQTLEHEYAHKLGWRHP